MRLPIVIVLTTLPSLASAAEFWVDPQNGSAGNDGSEANPWSTLQDVQDRIGSDVQGGDTVHLLPGDHGEVTLSGIDAATPIVIEADPPHEARLGRMNISGSSGLTIRGLALSREFAPAYTNDTIVSIDDSSQIVVEGCTLSSVEDASGWSDTDWDTLAANGFDVGGDDISIIDNVLRNVDFGISVTATNSLIRGNVVDYFSGDGLRGLGDYTVFEYNTVQNCIAVNDNHDDGFQSWSLGQDGEVGTGEVVGVVLRGNVIINYADPDLPYPGTLQGIGMFDGTFVDWVIENNVIITDHWHGITLLGARNSRVVNNTVMDPNDVDPGPPWISIDAHKDGTPPEDCVVRNNLTTDLANAKSGVVEDTNVLIEDPAALFVDAASFDLHLLPDAEVIDQGNPELAPELDADEIPRPQLDGYDLGAYEWHEDIPDPTDTDGSGSGGTDTASTGAGEGEGGTSDNEGSGSNASADASGESSGGAGEDSASGCGCNTGPASMPALVLLLLVRRRVSAGVA